MHCWLECYILVIHESTMTQNRGGCDISSQMVSGGSVTGNIGVNTSVVPLSQPKTSPDHPTCPRDGTECSLSNKNTSKVDDNGGDVGIAIARHKRLNTAESPHPVLGGYRHVLCIYTHMM